MDTRKVAEERVEVRMGQDCGIECVDKFCYLGDMIGAGGGAEDAARARVRCAWGKFRELAPILTSRGASLTLWRRQKSPKKSPGGKKKKKKKWGGEKKKKKKKKKKKNWKKKKKFFFFFFFSRLVDI